MALSLVLKSTAVVRIPYSFFSWKNDIEHIKNQATYVVTVGRRVSYNDVIVIIHHWSVLIEK